MKTLSDTAPPAASRDASRDVFEADLVRHARLLATAPMVRHQNQLWARKWEIVRALSEAGPQSVAELVRTDPVDSEAALEALVNEGLVSFSGGGDPGSRIVTLTLRGKTVLDTIRPPV